jgi:hypothetical protein
MHENIKTLALKAIDLSYTEVVLPRVAYLSASVAEVSSKSSSMAGA